MEESEKLKRKSEPDDDDDDRASVSKRPGVQIKLGASKPAAIRIELGKASRPSGAESGAKPAPKPPAQVAKVFGSDEEEDEEEEMPPEAKIRMRNIGRNTPTSQGPNSFGKSRAGFVDTRKLLEKQMKEQADELLRAEEVGAGVKTAAKKDEDRDEKKK